ncbi:hypothetical protein [Pedobacter nyackensis]|uniref:hypothetical protein n=1 Tax=Pedobacter nyackensis TaxID=475255 RepID=UPI00292D12EC|nr:hypothetical protein [Pedobacter nyackensis]
MEATSIDQITVYGKNFAKYSFLIGTALLITYCITRFDQLITLGLFYVALATIFNSIILLTTLIMIIIYPKHYLQLLKTAIIILLNLPIAFLYFLIVTNLPFNWF